MGDRGDGFVPTTRVPDPVTTLKILREEIFTGTTSEVHRPGPRRPGNDTNLSEGMTFFPDPTETPTKDEREVDGGASGSSREVETINSSSIFSSPR